MQKLKGLTLGLVCLLVVLPVAASADNISDMQAQIQSLTAQIRELQNNIKNSHPAPGTQLRESDEPNIPDSLKNVDERGQSNSSMQNGQSGSVSPNRREGREVREDRTQNMRQEDRSFDQSQKQGDSRGDSNRSLCAQVSRNLGFGSRGDDVREVQKMLATDPTIFTASTTGFFGKETARAMARFQEKNGLASSTNGFVGPVTRAYFGKQCASPRGMEMRNSMASSTRPMEMRNAEGNEGRASSTRMMPPPFPPRQDGQNRDSGPRQ